MAKVGVMLAKSTIQKHKKESFGPHEPGQTWVALQQRNKSLFGEVPRLLTRGNDWKYCWLLAGLASGPGNEVCRLPYGAPKADAAKVRTMDLYVNVNSSLDFIAQICEMSLHRRISRI
jgi:hypothetical protein